MKVIRALSASFLSSFSRLWVFSLTFEKWSAKYIHTINMSKLRLLQSFILSPEIPSKLFFSQSQALILILFTTFCNSYPLVLTQDGFFERKVSNLLFFFSSCVLIRALDQALFPQATLTGWRYILTYQCFQNGPGEMQPQGAHQLCPSGKQSLDIHWFKGVFFTIK